jgi:Zn-dependent peptidase ImmA (M78 family)
MTLSNQMTEAQYDAERAKLRERGETSIERMARWEQDLASLYYRTGRTQEHLAKKEGKSQFLDCHQTSVWQDGRPRLDYRYGFAGPGGPRWFRRLSAVRCRGRTPYPRERCALLVGHRQLPTRTIKVVVKALLAVIPVEWLRFVARKIALVMAARVKAHVTPALVTWARETAGFPTPSEAAVQLGIEEAQLAAWEDPMSGQKPSIPQLRRLAALFRRPLAVFYMAEPPTRFAVMRDLRRLPGTGLRHYSPQLQLEIRVANERRELALELAADLDRQLSTFALAATDREDPERVGARIRAALGVNSQLQSSWKDMDGRTGYNGWRSRIEDAGVLVFQVTRIEAEEASGFAIAADTLPVIAVNRKDPPTRRTFSLLHELAHLMVRVSGVSDLETDAKRPPEDQRIEVFCNHVAAAALIPKEALLSDPRVIAQGPRSTNWNDDAVSDLARQFNVSRETLLRRLLTFDRTTADFYRRKRAQYIAEYLATRERQKEKSADAKMRRNMPVETVSNFGRPLVWMLLSNYHQDRITLSEVSGYLGLKVKHIPKLEQVAGLRYGGPGDLQH